MSRDEGVGRRALHRAGGLSRLCRTVGFATLAAIAIVAAFSLVRSLTAHWLDLPFRISPLELPFAILTGSIWALRRERTLRRLRAAAVADRDPGMSEAIMLSDAPRSRLAPLALLIPLLLVWPVLLLDCLDAPARAWDGLVAWELKARSLHDDGAGSPYAVGTSRWIPPGFDARTVDMGPALQDRHATPWRQTDFYRHSPGHPLLQPYLMAGLIEFLGWPGARFWHAWLWLATLALLYGSSRHGTLAALLWAGIPLSFSLGGGSVGSGYADGLVAFLLCGAGVGLLRREPAWLVCAALALPLAKREGTLWAVLVMAAWLMARFGPSMRARVLCCTLPLAASLVLALVPGLIPSSLWLAGQEPSAGLSGLLSSLVWELRAAFDPSRFGLLFAAALLAALASLASRGDRPTASDRAQQMPLPWLTAAILCSLPLPFVLFPASGLEHHLRSTMDRLLLQVGGLTCLLVCSPLPTPARARSSAQGT